MFVFVFSGSIDMKSGNGGVRQYVALERPIGTSKPVQVDRKFLGVAYIVLHACAVV
jgi:hypothetical protein